MKIHAFNVEELSHYNIIFILSASFSLEDQQQVLDVMQRNGFAFQSSKRDRLPEELFSALFERFSYPGGRILARSNGIVP